MLHAKDGFHPEHMLICIERNQGPDQWMHAIFQSECALRRFLQRACATAERLVAKTSRKRQTTAQTLRESLSQSHESITLAAVVNA
jgi:hypothetical protein